MPAPTEDNVFIDQYSWEHVIASNRSARDLRARMARIADQVAKVDNILGRAVKRLNERRDQGTLNWVFTFPGDELGYLRIPVFYGRPHPTLSRWVDHYTHLGGDRLAMYHVIRRLRALLEGGVEPGATTRIIVSGDFGVATAEAGVTFKVWMTRDGAGAASAATHEWRLTCNSGYGFAPADDDPLALCPALAKVRALMGKAHPLFYHLNQYPFGGEASKGRYYYLYSGCSPEVSSFIFERGETQSRLEPLAQSDIDAVFAFMARVVQPAIIGELRPPSWERFLAAYHAQSTEYSYDKLRDALRGTEPGLEVDALIAVRHENKKFVGRLGHSLRYCLTTVAKVEAHDWPGIRQNVLLQAPAGTGKGDVARLIAGVAGVGEWMPIHCPSLDTGLSDFLQLLAKMPTLPGPRVVFLDEIDKASDSVQAQLLSVLEDREYYQGGEPRRIVAPLIIAAGSRDFIQLTREGKFLEDLHSRFNQKVVLSALAERPGETIVLARDLIERWMSDAGTKEVIEIDEFAAWFLYRYPWKSGNARELRAVISKVCPIAALDDSRTITLDMLRRHALELDGFGAFVLERSEIAD